MISTQSSPQEVDIGGWRKKKVRRKKSLQLRICMGGWIDLSFQAVIFINIVGEAV